MSISINRITEAWFEFKGVRSDALDIYMTQMPSRQLPARQLTRTKIAGRSGRARQTDNSYDDIDVSVSFTLLNPANINAVSALLTGSGTLRLSDDPDYVYNAVIEQPPQRAFSHRRFDAQAYDVTFSCHPFRQLYTPAPDIQATKGGVYTNPGTAEALPRVAITGSGAFDVTIGGMTMFFHDVETGVIVDSDLGDVLTHDGLLLANNNASGELFRIPSGQFLVDWTNGGVGADDDGNEVPLPGIVTGVTITPHWRYY